MIFCCGAYHAADKIYYLENENNFKNRRIEVLECCPSKNEKCRAFIVELIQTDIITGRTFVMRYKNYYAEKFLNRIKKQIKKNQYLQNGDKSKMNWVYGENKELKNKQGIIYKVIQRSVDFNNKKKNIKEIYLSSS